MKNEKNNPENELIVLGIETSCDDTSLCLLKGKRKSDSPQDSTPVTILSHKSFTQEHLLRKWGGVVPEIAARNHTEKLLPLLEEVTKEAQITLEQINLIGVTTMPGLLGPLLTGLNTAKTLSLLYQIPLITVNHLFAHLEAIHLTSNVPYPYLGLLVSGGHGLYFLVKSPLPGDFHVLGSTIDDAPGEAFDKGGKILGLPYPAGKYIDQYARQGDVGRFSFPIGLKDSKDARLSFSGLKTSLRLMVEKNPHFLEENVQQSQEFFDLCASYQEAIVRALELKLKFAVQEVGPLPIVVGGGVANNHRLRTVLKESFSKNQQQVYFVDPQFCADNGAMIAHYAYLTRVNQVPYPQCLYLDAKGKYL